MKNSNLNKPNLEASVKQNLFGKSHDSSSSEQFFFFFSVAFADEPPTWGHPPDPKVQSKSFKLLQRHLDHQEEEDGMFQKHFVTWTIVVASFHFNIIKWLDCGMGC